MQEGVERIMSTTSQIRMEEGFAANNVDRATGLLWVDTETTGLSAKKNAIAQISGIITNMDRVIQAHWSAYIRPSTTGREMDPAALAIHGFSESFLEKHGADEAAVATMFLAFASSYPNLQFAAFNAPFDLSFCYELLVKYELPIPYLVPAHDTLVEARKKLGKAVPNHKLTTVAQHFGYNVDGAHNSTVDIFTTVKVDRQLLLMAA